MNVAPFNTQVNYIRRTLTGKLAKVSSLNKEQNFKSRKK